MTTDQLRVLLRSISALAWLPHTEKDEEMDDPERDPHLLVALGLITGIADKALEADEWR